MYRQQIAKKNTPSLASTPITKKTRPTPSYGSLSGMIQRAKANPETLSREEWRQLDGAVGTRATNEIKSGKQTSYVPAFKGISSQLLGESVVKETPIQAKLTIGAAGDKYEQEADRVAAEVVKQIHSPAPVSNTQGEVVQGKSSIEEEGELQRKPMVQRRADAGGEASAELASAINSARGGGQPLDAGLQQSMGEAMGADFSGVRVHTDARSDELNQSIQAKAFTTGRDVFFRQGTYQPESREGQELIAHELTHVFQSGKARKREKSPDNSLSCDGASGVVRRIDLPQLNQNFTQEPTFGRGWSTLCDHVIGLVTQKGVDGTLYHLYNQKGGWESWLQSEVGLIGQRMNWQVSREENYPPLSQGGQVDVCFTKGTEMMFMEIKCMNRNHAVNGFINLVNNDKTKLRSIDPTYGIVKTMLVVDIPSVHNEHATLISELGQPSQLPLNVNGDMTRYNAYIRMGYV